MGLASGENGVKATLKKKYGQATVVTTTLAQAVACVGVLRGKTVIVLDGNVLLQTVPQSASSLGDYIRIVSSSIRAAMGTSKVVIVVFDEPQCLTSAKAGEQRQRDATRKKKEPQCSTDIVAYPKTDAYGMNELSATADCHAIVGCRPSRQRFFDQVCLDVMKNLKRDIDSWQQQGHEAVLLFDGLDPLGAERPAGQERKPQIFGTSPDIAALFQREEAIGEGDLKLLWAQRRVKALVHEGKMDVDLHVTSTIDTDSLAIHLLDEASRTGAPEGKQVQTMLAFREAAGKRAREEDEDARASYWCVDTAAMHELLQDDLWAATKKQPSPTESRCAMALLAAGWAMAGCDFCTTTGLSARMVFDAIPAMIKASPDLVALMAHSFEEGRDGAKKPQLALRRLMLICAGNLAEKKGSRKAYVEGMRNDSADTVLRACWVCAYWTGVEYHGSLTDFGFPGAESSGDVVATATIKACTGPMPWEPPPRVVSKYFAPEARKQDSVEGAVEA